MKLNALLLLGIVAASSAFEMLPSSREDRRKAIDSMILKLGNIRENIISMKPTITTLAQMVDSLTSNGKTEAVATAKSALDQLNEKNIPPKCLQEATFKLSLIAEPVSNCSSLHIVEDAGSIMYNSANFIALAMMYLDEVDNGLSECSPWYNIFHSIPCYIRYVYTSFRYVTGIVGKALGAYSVNEKLFLDIVEQIKCKQEEIFVTRSLSSPSQIMSDAYLCAKNST